MSDLFFKLYKKYFLVPAKKDSKAPTLSISKYNGKKIPLEEFNTGRFGIVAGHNDIEILDIDNHFGNAKELYDLIREHCKVDNLPHCSSPSGGYHIYYKVKDKVYHSQKLAMRWDGKKVTKGGKPIPEAMLETRGLNNYCIAPPSDGYAVINGDLSLIEYISEEERDFMIELSKAQNEYVSELSIKGQSKSSSNTELSYNEKSGDKFNREGDSEIRAILSRHGWTTNNDVYWVRPGKKRGISATLGKAVSKSGNKLFQVFSTSTDLQANQYTYFGLYTELECNGDFSEAAKKLGEKYGIKPVKKKAVNVKSNEKIEIKKKNHKEHSIDEYIRVSNSYFRDVDGMLFRWTRQNIVDDFSKDALNNIDKYVMFVNEPNHIDYERVINDRYYNRYSPPKVYPSEEEGDFPKIKILLKHLFKDQYEIALDWIQISYVTPRQRLPVVCLVGEKNETGKSGFGRLMKYIYADNYASISMGEYKSEFNSSYINKNIVAIEEGKMATEEIEKLKKDMTDDVAYLREMHVDRVKIDNFAKYIINSNRANDFINVTSNDNRFWIKKVDEFPKENYDPYFDDKIIKEVPFFLNFIMTRELHVKEKEGRFWLGEHRYLGDEFKNVVISSRKDFINELYYSMLDSLDNEGHDAICGSAVRLKEWFCYNNFRMNAAVIKKSILSDFKGIKMIYGRYDKYDVSASLKEYRGNYFRITRSMLNEVLGLDSSVEEVEVVDDMPF